MDGLGIQVQFCAYATLVVLTLLIIFLYPISKIVVPGGLSWDFLLLYNSCLYACIPHSFLPFLARVVQSSVASSGLVSCYMVTILVCSGFVFVNSWLHCEIWIGHFLNYNQHCLCNRIPVTLLSDYFIAALLITWSRGVILAFILTLFYMVDRNFSLYHTSLNYLKGEIKINNNKYIRNLSIDNDLVTHHCYSVTFKIALLPNPWSWYLDN